VQVIEVGMSTRLRDAEGFVVETPSGRFGTVEAFRAGGGSVMADALVVKVGRLGRRRVMISVDDVAAVRPRERVVQLRSKWMSMRV
jgi:hypothetical protein